jgi:quinol-cytochrome oxidoreductase complex cytochrome b subunit
MVDYSKGRSEEELEAFYPNEILRHTILTFLFISAIMLGVLFLPESSQQSTDEFASLQTRPPWFFLPFYYCSSLINNMVWHVAILVIYAITFISVPFLDRNTEKRLWKKPIFLTIVIINLLMIFVLGLTRYLQ